MLFNPRVRKYKYRWYPAKGAFWADAGRYYLRAKEERGRWYWLIAAQGEGGGSVIKMGSARSLPEAKRDAEAALLKIAPALPRTLFNRKNADPRFEALAEAQRGAPEGAMMRLSMAQISQLYGTTAEHVGDLTHRMSQSIDFFKGGYQWVAEKVRRTLNWLTNPYGFEREVREQVVTNFRYSKELQEKEGRPFEKHYGRSPQDALLRLKRLGRLYAAEHRKLPVFNTVQRIARDAAVAVGEWRFKNAVSKLKTLKYLLDKGPDVWAGHAMKTKNNPKMNPMSEREWWAWAKKDLEYKPSEQWRARIERMVHAYRWHKPPEQVRAMLWSMRPKVNSRRARRNISLPSADIFEASAYGLTPNARRRANPSEPPTIWRKRRRGKKTLHYRGPDPRFKTYYVARFRPPYPQRGEFWTASEMIDLLPATVVGGVYKISASNRVAALAQAKAAHARGR